MLILHHSLNGYLRYNQLKRSRPELAILCYLDFYNIWGKYDFVKRIQYLEKVPRVEYFIAKQDKKPAPAFTSIAEWGKERMALEKIIEE